MTNYTSDDILNFIKDLFTDDTNLISVKMNPENAPLNLQSENSPILIAHNSITIKFKDINKSNYFRTVHDTLKDYLKDNSQSFNLITASGNRLMVLLL